MFRLTVQKEGNNKGRQFYTCPKGNNSDCNFFKWADEVDGQSAAAPARPAFSNNWNANQSGQGNSWNANQSVQGNNWNANQSYQGNNSRSNYQNPSSSRQNNQGGGGDAFNISGNWGDDDANEVMCNCGQAARR